MKLQKLLCQDCRALKLDKLLYLAKEAEAYKHWNEKSKKGRKGARKVKYSTGLSPQIKSCKQYAISTSTFSKLQVWVTLK